MWKRSLAAALALALTTLSHQVTADTPVVSMCSVQSADVTLNLGILADGVSSFGNSAVYGNRPTCRRYVTDVVVPMNSSPSTSGLKPQFALWAKQPGVPTTKGGCDTYERHVTYYKKDKFQKYNRIGEVIEKGTWQPSGRCTVSTQPGTSLPPAEMSPPQSGTETYRIAQSLKIGRAWQHVVQGAQHTKSGTIAAEMR